jgi:cation diffusion facilitator family transporter
VTIIGAKLSRKKPDKEHPFGHGRYEYISSLIVSFIIILVGVELFKGSVQKIFNPEIIVMSPWLVGFLCLSLPIKFWMYRFNRALGKAVNSGAVLATAKDSLNDVVATGAVIITSVVGKFIDFPPLDGIVGTVVSLMIIYSGFGITMDTIGLLLGTTPDPELSKYIRTMVMEAQGVVGVHDLIVHDYGPGRVLASVHAEVPDNCNVVEIHEVIDALEHKINDELGIHIVIHMDPISVNCEYTTETKLRVQEIIKSIDERMNIHDFRMVDGNNNINLIFDIEVPADFGDTEALKAEVGKRLSMLDSRFNAVIDIDTLFC